MNEKKSLNEKAKEEKTMSGYEKAILDMDKNFSELSPEEQKKFWRLGSVFMKSNKPKKIVTWKKIIKNHIKK